MSESMIINNADSIPLEGELSVTLKFNNGMEVPYFREKNVITNASKGHILAMVYDKNNSVVPDPILTFKVGDGGTLDGTTGPGGISGVNARPLSGVESSLFSPIHVGQYSHTALSHNLENATTATSGPWAVTTGYAGGNTVAASSAAFGPFVFEASAPGTSGAVEPSWNPVLGGVTADETISWVTRPRSLAAKSVTYSFSLNSSQLNSYPISEVGLVKASGALFNIKTFASIPKSSAFSIQFLWTIRYA